MRDLNAVEIELVSGGGVPQCHANDPAPYGDASSSLASLLKTWLLVTR